MRPPLLPSENESDRGDRLLHDHEAARKVRESETSQVGAMERLGAESGRVWTILNRQDMTRGMGGAFAIAAKAVSAPGLASRPPPLTWYECSPIPIAPPTTDQSGRVSRTSRSLTQDYTDAQRAECLKLAVTPGKGIRR